MIYATEQDMIGRFGAEELSRLTDIAMPPEAPDEAKIFVAIMDASSLADTYLSRRYALPIKGCANPAGGGDLVPPPVLTRIVCDLARYNLYTDITKEHEAYQRRADALRLLESIAVGNISLGCPLGDTAALEISATDSGETISAFSPREIADADLRGY
ncbi:MAG: DUF1320 domain-containing protein [Zoogloeaceae bacterium]|jgi:phage gp36-like protein|nr:DUF1320 domain-containing protein [Zoogloeaceae bacterium]